MREYGIAYIRKIDSKRLMKEVAEEPITIFRPLFPIASATPQDAREPVAVIISYEMYLDFMRQGQNTPEAAAEDPGRPD